MRKLLAFITAPLPGADRFLGAQFPGFHPGLTSIVPPGPRANFVGVSPSTRKLPTVKYRERFPHRRVIPQQQKGGEPWLVPSCVQVENG